MVTTDIELSACIHNICGGSKHVSIIIESLIDYYPRVLMKNEDKLKSFLSNSFKGQINPRVLWRYIVITFVCQAMAKAKQKFLPKTNTLTGCQGC